MKTSYTLASAVALFAAAAPAQAIVTVSPTTNYSFTGNLATANDVALFNFTVADASNVTLRTWSYAGGTNAAGTVIPNGGFDPILALFDSSGLRIAQNDDGGSNVPADTNGRRYDTFLEALLQPGTYTVSVMEWSNFSVGPNLSNGFQNDPSNTFGGRSTFFAFDVLNVATAVDVSAGAVPEPGTWAMMLIGFGGIGFSMRKARRAKAVAAFA